MQWFYDLVNWIWCILKSFFYFVVESLLEIMDIIMQFVLFILPDSPFQFERIEWGDVGHSIGYFIPVSSILSHFITILSAITTYYGVRYLLRIIKQVGD